MYVSQKIDFLIFWLFLLQISFFGLQYINKKGREWWLTLDKSICKQLERHGKNGCHNVILSFRVHFFVSDIDRLQEEVTRLEIFRVNFACTRIIIYQ